MHLKATKAGVGVPRGPFGCTVEAVFPNTCLLALEGGALLTMVSREIGGLPHGLTLSTPRGFAFRGRIAGGEEAAARGGVLRFARSALAIDLRTARPWRSRLASFALDPAEPAQSRAWQSVWAMLQADGRAAPFIALASPQIAALLEAPIRQAGDGAGATAALSALVGLGEGSTPAGDDFLVGFLAGLHAGAGNAARHARLLAHLRDRLAEAAARTSRVSRLYLMAAAGGEVSERLARLAAAIAEGAEGRRLALRTASTLAVGHSSGACGVLGLLLGSRVRAAPSSARAAGVGALPYADFVSRIPSP